MDLLKLIKEKADYFLNSTEDFGVASVIKHIEIAERHFEGGKAGDEYLFNDVIYRSNQAFEGVLKEAHRILKGENSGDVSPYKIEKYFEENKILKERVLQLFTNYRTEWRNKSTHDYKLYFSEQEALLAIVSISAFVNILFDQMIEKKSYEKEITSLKDGTSLITDPPSDYSLIDKLIYLLLSFRNEIPKISSGAVLPKIRESELLGALTAFITNFITDIQVLAEHGIPMHGQHRKLFADLYVETKNEKVIIEVKSSLQQNLDIINRGTEQILNYLLLAGVSNGILYIFPKDDIEEMMVSSIEKVIENKTYKIFHVYPKKLNNLES
jgi:hypothetical protein